MADRLYSSTNLSNEEVPFKDCFEHLCQEFDYDGYEIWIKNTDFQRYIGVGIVNRTANPPVAATVWLKYGSSIIDAPVTADLINVIRENLRSGIECEFNKHIIHNH
jgi:hypothetical protein